MKIVHTADWHLGKQLGEYSLLEDQRYYFTRFIEWLSRNRPDALVIAGDIYDRSVPSAEATQLLSDILCQIVMDLKIETFLIAGNHDSKERLSFAGDLLAHSGLHIAGVLPKQLVPIPFEEVQFYLLPYLNRHLVRNLFPDEEIKTESDALRVYLKGIESTFDPDAFHLLVAHGLFGGHTDDEVAVGGSELTDTAPLAPFDYVALGHLHRRQTAGAPHFMYAGAPLAYAIDEVGEKSFTVLTVQGNRLVGMETVSLPPLRQIRTVTGTLEELISHAQQHPSDDYIFAELTDPALVLNAIRSLQAVYPHVLGLRYLRLQGVGPLPVEKKRVMGKNLLSLYREFYDAVMPEPLSEEDQTALSVLWSAEQEVTE